jgi:NRPS condensation-like uncharacterized protein
VWRLCDGSETLDQIVKLLARAYGVEPSEIHGEVVETVKGFRERKLLDEDLRA